MIDPIGLRLIHSALLEKKVYLLTDTYQFTDDLKNVINFCLNYKVEYKEYPQIFTVEEKFGISFSEKLEPFDFVSDLFLERQHFQEAEKLLKEQIEDYENRDITNFIDKADNFVKKYQKTQTKNCISYKDSAEERFEHYLKLESGEIEDGIDTPWPSLNKQIKKWINGTLNIILGNTGLGKSYSLCVCANKTSEDKKNSLFISTEMSPTSISKRLDVIKFKLKSKDLRDAELDFISKDRYKHELVEYKNSNFGDVIIAGKNDVQNVNDVLKLINIYNPKILYLDGGYRLKPRKEKGSNWENQHNLVKELQLAAEQTNIPWVITSQLWLDDKKIKDNFDIKEAVKYGKEWVIDPDVVIALKQNQDMEHMNVMELNVIKIREAPKKGEPILIHWNKDTMDYSEITKETIVADLGNIIPDNEIKF